MRKHYLDGKTRRTNLVRQSFDTRLFLPSNEAVNFAKLFLIGPLICGLTLSACRAKDEQASKSEVQFEDYGDYRASELFTLENQTYLNEAETAFFETGRSLPELSPERRRNLIRRLNNESSQAANNNNFDKARKYTQISHELREKSVREEPDNYFHKLSLSTSFANLGELEQMQKNYDLARQHYLRSIAILEGHPPLLERSSLWEKLMASKFRMLGKLEGELKKHDAAVENYETALKFIIKNPTNQNYFIDSANVHSAIADVNFQQKKWKDAVKNYQISARLLKKSLEIQPDRDYLIKLRELAYAYQGQAYSAAKLSDKDIAKLAYKKALMVRKRAIAHEHAQSFDELDLAYTFFLVAQSNGNYELDESQEYLTASNEIFKRFEEQNSVPSKYIPIFEKVREELR